MSILQRIALAYAIILGLVSALNYLPIDGIVDDDGLAFGVFALDIYDDLLHLGSALWALAAALTSHRAAKTFLVLFGALYLADGALGLATGSGYLDLGIFIYGFYEYPSFLIKIAANMPHIVLGGIALASGLIWGNRA